MARVLVVSDLHANSAALEAVLARETHFDVCLCLGDLVDYGGSPAECVEWVMNHAPSTVRGNHDHAVAQNVVARGGSGFRGLVAATRPLQAPLLSARQRKFLSRMPLTQQVQIGETRFYLVHATPRDPLDEYVFADVDAWRTRLDGIEADFVLVGHTHCQYDLDVDGIRVVNPGSVGQPRDGDPRAAYAVIEGTEVSLRRVEYDIDAAVASLKRAGIARNELELSEAVWRSGGKLPSPPAAD